MDTSMGEGIIKSQDVVVAGSEESNAAFSDSFTGVEDYEDSEDDYGSDISDSEIASTGALPPPPQTDNSTGCVTSSIGLVQQQYSSQPLTTVATTPALVGQSEGVAS